MDLEKVLKKYDFVRATEETSDEFRDLLNENQSDFEEAGNLKSLQRCLSVLQEKLCIKGYPVDGTPGYDMAFTSIEIIGDVMDECVDNDRASEKDCQKMLFEFLLACICVGSGSTVMEIISKVLGIQDLKNYIQEMKETELVKIFSALKKVTHTSEEPKVSIVDQASAWDDCVSGVILDLLSENTNIATAECQDQLLDLYMFYYLRMTDMPVEYALSLHRVMSNIQDFYREKYGCNPFKAIKNTDGIRKHMVTVQGVVCNEKFGRSEKQLDMTQKIVELILYSISEKLKDLESIWGSVLDFMKTMAFSKKCAEHPQVLEPFGRHLFDELPEDYVTDHPQLIDEWASVFGEILLKAPSVNALHTWAYRMADTAQGLAVVKKESAVIWFPLVKGLLRCGHQQSLNVAERILEGVKFKKIWTWKKNYNHAMEMIETISKVDFPTSGKDSDVKLLRAYGDIIKCLLEQLSLVKVAEKAMGVVSVFVINLMEKRSETLNEFTEGFASSISLQNNLEVIPDLIKKFSALIMDEDYPWDHSDTQRCGESILINIIDAYSSGMDMPDDVVKTMVNMFLYAMETDDLDYMNVVTGFVSMHGCVASTFLRRFVDKHLGTENADRVLVPLMPVIMKQLNHEEDSLKEASRTILSLASNQAPAAISPYLPAVIKWYAATRDIKALSALWMPYKKSDGISQEDFNELMKTMKSDTQADSGSMQSVILMDIGEKQPELFTKESVDMMLSERFIDSTNDQYRILCALTFVVPKKSEMFGINIVDRVLRNKELNLTYTSALQSIGVSLASQHPELVDTVLAELVNLSKKCDNPVFQVALIDGIHTVGTQQGPERLKPHRPYIEDLQKDGATAGIKEMATSILNAMDGISVEGIVEDVKQQKGDINVLNTKVTENTEKVNVVDKKVDNQGKEIATVKTGLQATDKRVDNVEKDLDETKIKVEEVDNKTMTNAPKWSRDLTKLMNPTTEHDWRLLAQRLGYTPQDIKGWATQHDPCMGLLSEWYATHKTIEATHAVLTALQEMNRMDAAAIVENAMKAVEGVVEEEVDYVTPPPIFLSYQWGHQNEVKLLRNHLQMAGYECWMDIGQMGGGDKLFEKIDNGIRGAKIIICCVSEKYSKSPNCNREVNLSTNLGKPMIPLLMEKMSWPPKGSMGPIFSEYLFVRFFQRGGEETKDQRYWPVPKFQELLMQLNMYQALPEESLITKEYKNWWKPVAEEIVITKIKGGDKGQSSSGKQPSLKEGEDSPDVFLSYQWGKQNQIKQLYRRLNELGYSCWMDIYQMGGGDSLYDKIDRGVRGCKVVLSCVTTKYTLSANCRREVSLADSLKKPMVPLLLEKMDWPPAGPMSMVFTQLLFINFYRDEKVQMSWDGSKFDELHGKINEYLSLSAGDQPAIKGPEKGPKEETNKSQAQVSSKEVTKPAQHAQEEQVTPKEETKTVVKPNKKSSSCILL
ncbi:uncharacterized protein LOC132543123 [Ylistrum balloti]|uniref:uncharacterized protein LOC132543123 n=1 Tax=Ylistrum balloti TaxID=509963 RepID=UPI0029059B34|nr:uncharacterized protein LOC132543123 [Ylistrum balloti]